MLREGSERCRERVPREGERGESERGRGERGEERDCDNFKVLRGRASESVHKIRVAKCGCKTKL